MRGDALDTPSWPAYMPAEQTHPHHPLLSEWRQGAAKQSMECIADLGLASNYSAAITLCIEIMTALLLRFRSKSAQSTSGVLASVPDVVSNVRSVTMQHVTTAYLPAFDKLVAWAPEK